MTITDTWERFEEAIAEARTGELTQVEFLGEVVEFIMAEVEIGEECHHAVYPDAKNVTIHDFVEFMQAHLETRYLG